ncbi:hypothetical protein Tco_0010913 [Tanacetum coccineum]
MFFNFEPVSGVTNDFDVLNDVESFDSGEGENVDSLNIEEEDSFTFTIRSFLHSVPIHEDMRSKGFSGFWKLHGSILWKDKAIPTISIDGLQSSLHKWENSNLLSLASFQNPMALDFKCEEQEMMSLNISERITKTKRSKNSQKPTRNRNGKKKKESREKVDKSARDTMRFQPAKK